MAHLQKELRKMTMDLDPDNELGSDCMHNDLTTPLRSSSSRPRDDELFNSILFSPSTSIPSQTNPFPVIDWLRDHYEEATPEDTIPRALIYQHYKDMTNSNMVSTTFGKFIRKAFPKVESRRLGGKANNSYHYVGIKEKVYCTCRKPSHGKMIACDSCDEWFHLECLDLDETQLDLVDNYLC